MKKSNGDGGTQHMLSEIIISKMHRGRGGRDDFFDPFAGFGGFEGNRSLMSEFFGKDPFEDPFFTRPFGGMFGSSMLGSSMHGPSMFGPVGSPFGNFPKSGFPKQRSSQSNKSKGPVIQEITSDDEEDKESKDIHENHSRKSKEPFVEHPDDENEGRKNTRYGDAHSRTEASRPHNQTYSFMSSTVRHGGINGSYYSSSTTRKMAGDGVMLEENKEADSTTGKATHRISRGIHNKGHSVTRNLCSDAKVNTVQTLHNLVDDELAGFEESWQTNARKHLPGWNAGFSAIADSHAEGRRGAKDGQSM